MTHSDILTSSYTYIQIHISLLGHSWHSKSCCNEEKQQIIWQLKCKFTAIRLLHQLITAPCNPFLFAVCCAAFTTATMSTYRRCIYRTFHINNIEKKKTGNISVSRVRVEESSILNAMNATFGFGTFHSHDAPSIYFTIGIRHLHCERRMLGYFRGKR